MTPEDNKSSIVRVLVACESTNVPKADGRLPLYVLWSLVAECVGLEACVSFRRLRAINKTAVEHENADRTWLQRE